MLLRIQDGHVTEEPDRLPAMESQLKVMNDLLILLLHKGDDMAGQLDALTREVAESRTVTESAVTLLGELSTKIEQLKNDPVALQALADELDAQQTKLAAAISANTPAGPTP